MGTRQEQVLDVLPGEMEPSFNSGVLELAAKAMLVGG